MAICLTTYTKRRRGSLRSRLSSSSLTSSSLLSSFTVTGWSIEMLGLKMSSLTKTVTFLSSILDLQESGSRITAQILVVHLATWRPRCYSSRITTTRAISLGLVWYFMRSWRVVSHMTVQTVSATESKSSKSKPSWKKPICLNSGLSRQLTLSTSAYQEDPSPVWVSTIV